MENYQKPSLEFIELDIENSLLTGSDKNIPISTFGLDDDEEWD